MRRLSCLFLWLLLAASMPSAAGCLSERDRLLDPVDPAPDTLPTPADDASPFRVLILYEEDDFGSYPRGQQNLLKSAQLTTWLDDHKAEWRVWDDDVDATNSDQFWQDALKLNRDSLPWLWASKGRDGFQGPLPENYDDAIRLLTEVAE